MKTHTAHHTSQEDRLPLKQLVAYGFGGIVPIALFNCVGQLTQLMGNISLGISAFWLGVILVIPRLWDAVSDPLVGHFSDNTRNRFGRRRPFIMIGGIGVAISFCALWWVPQGVSQIVQLSYLLGGLLIFFTCCTIFEIPHGALGMEMSPDYHQRTRLFSAKSFFGNLFAMATPWLFYFANLPFFKGEGNEIDGMRMVSLFLLVVLIPMSIWWFFTLKEPAFENIVKKKEKTPFWQDMKTTMSNKTFLSLVVIVFTLAMGFNFVGLLNYYISIYYLYGGDKVAAGPLLGINGTIWGITGLLAVFPLNFISERLGKRNTMLIAIGLMCSAQLSKIVCYDPQNPYLVIIPTILLSAGMLFFFTLASSMVGDICDEDDLNTGSRSEGSYYSVFWWFIKMGTAFASMVTGALILFTQFNETQVRKVDSVSGGVQVIAKKVSFWYEGNQTLPDDKLKSQRIAFIDSLQKSIDKSQELLDLETNAELMKSSQIDLKINQTYLQNAQSLQSQIDLSFTKQSEVHNKEAQSFILQFEYLKFSRDADALEQTLREDIATNPNKAKNNSEHIHSLNSIRTGLALAIEQNRALEALAKKESIELDESAFSIFLTWIKGKCGIIEEVEERPKVALEIELENLRIKAVSLSRQTNKTLLLMRAVEIGLPLLLSLISLTLTLKYPLSEEKCYEIKAQLKERNEANTSPL